MTKMLVIILFILPVLTSARITVNITIHSNKNKVNIKSYGNDNKIATNAELNIFNVTMDNLKKGIRVELGKVPDDIYLRDPTYIGNLFQKFKWQPVQRSLHMHKAKVVEIFNEEIVLKRHEHINNSTISMKSKRNIATIIENSAQSLWFNYGLSGNDLIYTLHFNFGYSNFTYNNIWRNDTIRYSRMTIEASKEGYINIKPFQSVVTELIATKTILLIELQYKAELVGATVANYVQNYGGHHFWAPSIKDIMKAARIKNEIVTKEHIEICCFINPRLRIYDSVTGENLMPIMMKPAIVDIFQNKNLTRVLKSYKRLKIYMKQKNN